MPPLPIRTPDCHFGLTHITDPRATTTTQSPSRRTLWGTHSLQDLQLELIQLDLERSGIMRPWLILLRELPFGPTDIVRRAFPWISPRGLLLIPAAMP